MVFLLDKTEFSSIVVPIEGKQITVSPTKVKVDQVVFDELNPRISLMRDSYISETKKGEFDQKMIEFALKAQPSFSELKESIRNNKGALVPIWVYPKSGKYIVIEGNTRLLVYKMLKEEEDTTDYDAINCFILPQEIEEEEKDFIRLTSHLNGHTDWDKYEQAKYLFNLYNVHKYPIKQLAKKTKLKPEEIRQDIESFEIMSTQFYQDYGQDRAFIHRFSYFKEFVKDKKLRYLMEDLKLDSKDFCEWVGERKIEKAADVRKLRPVLETNKSREMFLKKDLDRAIEILRDLVPEKADKLYTQMQHLNEMLDEVSFQDASDVFSSDNPKRKIFMELQEKMCDISLKFSK